MSPPFHWTEDAESTSAKLRRVEQERDEAKQSLAEALDRVDDAERECAEVRTELDSERDKRAEDIAAYERACGLAVVAERERDEARAERDEMVQRKARVERDLGAALAEARCPRCGIEVDAEVEGSGILARDDGYDCERCQQGIRRGERYELLPGIDEYRHIHCRTEEPTDG